MVCNRNYYTVFLNYKWYHCLIYIICFILKRVYTTLSTNIQVGMTRKQTHSPVSAGSEFSLCLEVDIIFHSKRKNIGKMKTLFPTPVEESEWWTGRIFQFIKLFQSPSVNQLMFKYGPQGGRPAGLEQHKGTLFKVTSTCYYKQWEEWTVLSDW